MKALAAALLLLLTASACDQDWPSTGQTRAPDDQSVVILVASCGSESVSSVEVTGSSGNILWQVSADEPQDLFTFEIGKTPPGWTEAVPLNRQLLPEDPLEVTVAQTTSSGRSFTTRDSFPVGRVTSSRVYVGGDEEVGIEDYQAWAKSHVCESWPGLVALARHHPERAVLGGFAAIGGLIALTGAFGAVRNAWRRRS
ncbi:MAG: hypothetical protein HY875_03625 [Chloroflexi bacterium]|nr:hypothetical protein [Chloroflexota bacterium]